MRTAARSLPGEEERIFLLTKELISQTVLIQIWFEPIVNGRLLELRLLAVFESAICPIFKISNFLKGMTKR